MKKLFLLFLILISGCATMQPLPTPSGKPEIVLPNTTKSEVTERFIRALSIEGFTIKTQTINMLILEKPAKDYINSLFYGSRFNSTPHYRIQIQLTDVTNGVWVMFDLSMVSNPGSPFEHTTDLNKTKDAHTVYQGILNAREALLKR